VVSLIGRWQKQVEGGDLGAPLAAYRGAAAQLPNRDDSLLDQLFALECLARGGRDARGDRERLLPARRRAESYVDQEWESDVPHAAVLGQAIAAVHALSDDPPEGWLTLLEETLTDLEQRQARLGIASDPLLIAGVIRGLAASGLPLPSRLLDAARGYFEERPQALGAAELGDALVRHPNGRELASHAVEIVFSQRHSSDDGAAVARWWLADRWFDVVGAEVADDDTVAAARAQAILAPAPANPRVAAMLAEIAARGVASLVFVPSRTLELIRSSARGRSLVENYMWRTIALVAALSLAVVYLRDIVGRLGVSKPSEALLTALTVTLVTLASAAVVIATKSALRKSGRTIPAAFEEIDWVVPVLVALITFFLRT
jgi:hypothetical protein